MTTEERIKEVAYQLWQREGRPEGKDLEHYFTAMRLVEEQSVPPAPAAESRTNGVAAPSTNGGHQGEAPVAVAPRPRSPRSHRR